MIGKDCISVLWTDFKDETITRNMTNHNIEKHWEFLSLKIENAHKNKMFESFWRNRLTLEWRLKQFIKSLMMRHLKTILLVSSCRTWNLSWSRHRQNILYKVGTLIKNTTVIKITSEGYRFEKVFLLKIVRKL